MRGKDPQIAAVLRQIIALEPDILALLSVDFDFDGIAAELLKEKLAKAGRPMPHHFSAQPNTGVATGFDLDRNGYFGDARDMQGYGTFTGQDGMLLLSRYPIAIEAVRDFSALIWAETPDHQMPDGYFSQEEEEALRLHSTAAWEVPVETPEGVLRVLMSKAGPPVFDGPEDRNGRRNGDEIAFWTQRIANDTDGEFVIMAGLNNDPVQGEGLKPPLRALLGSAGISDARPLSDEFGDATVNWDFGRMRVDYILPSVGLTVLRSKVAWDGVAGDEDYGSRHRPVWMDIALP